MKLIENIELLKKLQPYLEDVETEYNKIKLEHNKTGINYKIELSSKNPKDYMFYKEHYKTLTLEEAIELLPETFFVEWIRMWWYIFPEYIWEFTQKYKMSVCEYWTHNQYELFNWVTLLQAIEKMLEYLIDNDLLWNQ